MNNYERRRHVNELYQISAEIMMSVGPVLELCKSHSPRHSEEKRTRPYVCGVVW